MSIKTFFSSYKFKTSIKSLFSEFKQVLKNMFDSVFKISFSSMETNKRTKNGEMGNLD